MNKNTLLIKNATIVTVNRDMQILSGDILIENKRIRAIAPHIEHETENVFNARDFLIVPGFVQTHIHLGQTLFRNQAEDLALLDWLSQVIWPGEARHTEETVRLSAHLSLAELLRNGTTTIMDIGLVRHANVLFESIAQSGIRAVAGKMLMDYGDGPQALLEDTDAALAESVELLRKWHGFADDRIRYAFAPRFVLSSSDRLLRQLADLAQKYEVIVHSHASENKDEVRLVQERFGMRNIEVFDHFGLADGHLCLAHCIWTDEHERRLMREKDIKVLHCPSANLKLGSGIAPVPDYLQRGITVSLGADGAPCNNNLNIFTEMRLAGLIQKYLHGPQAMPAQTVFKLATIGGARALGLEHEVGSIEPGKKADLVFIKRNQVHSIPDENIYAKLIYATQSEDVRHVMIDGRWVMRERQLLTIDEEQLLKQIKL